MSWEVVQVFAANLFQLFEGSLVVLATGLGGIVLHKIAVKFGLQNEAELKAGLDFAITHGVHGAEGWANKQANAPTGSDKMDEAVKIARMLMANDAFKNLTDENLKKLIEAKLSMTINNPTQPDVVEVAKALKTELAK